MASYLEMRGIRSLNSSGKFYYAIYAKFCRELLPSSALKVLDPYIQQ
jgi:hypothetical protein